MSPLDQASDTLTALIRPGVGPTVLIPWLSNVVSQPALVSADETGSTITIRIDYAKPGVLTDDSLVLRRASEIVAPFDIAAQEARLAVSRAVLGTQQELMQDSDLPADARALLQEVTSISQDMLGLVENTVALYHSDAPRAQVQAAVDQQHALASAAMQRVSTLQTALFAALEG